MAEPTDEQWAAIEAELYARRKIAAIKLYRKATGADLKEAKELIEEHEAGLRQQFPDRFSKKSGCGTAVVALAVLMVGVIVWFW